MADETGSTPKRDFRQEVTDNIIRMLEQGTAPWQKPWEAGKLGMPHNPTTEKAYRGGNAVHLMSVAAIRGYEDPRWLTYKQAEQNGWQVRKGERGTQIEYWEFPDASNSTKIRDGKEGESADRSSKNDDERRIVHRIYTVFNAQQIEGIPAYTPKQDREFEGVQAGDSILRNSGATIRNDQDDRAFYNRRTDSIHLPPQAAFKSAADYYGTALHELAHWTGHPSRLNRNTLNESYRFGDTNYAQEELRAELASVFLAAERGIPHNPEQHAAYVGSWINALRNDKNEIFRAAKDANRAADFLLSLELERSVAAEELDSHPLAAEPEAARATPADLERETQDLKREETAARDAAMDLAAEMPANQKDTPLAFEVGDKIVALEPYHYGGKPKKEPERPGIVQSVSSDREYISYMRLAPDGSLDYNGTKPVSDPHVRLANSADLKQFQNEFAQLESKFRETTRTTAQYEPGSGTVTVQDKQALTEHRSVVDDSARRIAEQGERITLRGSFADAQNITKTTLGSNARTYSAQTDSGIYRGPVIGETDLHVVQQLNGQSAVAHMKHMLSPIPNVGENVLVRYHGNDFARVSQMRERSRGKELVR